MDPMCQREHDGANCHVESDLGQRIADLERLWLAAQPLMYLGRGVTQEEIHEIQNRMRKRHGLCPLDPPRDPDWTP